MRDRGPGARVIEFAIEERHRRFTAGRRVLEVGGSGEGAWPSASEERYEGAWVALADLEGVDLPALGRRLASALVSGAPVVCIVPAARPLVGLLHRALRGADATRIGGESDGAEARGGVSLVRWKEAFGSAYRWHRARALGLLIAPAPGEDGADRNPHAFAALAALEHLIGTWPVFRGLGERILLEGERR